MRRTKHTDTKALLRALLEESAATRERMVETLDERRQLADGIVRSFTDRLTGAFAPTPFV